MPLPGASLVKSNPQPEQTDRPRMGRPPKPVTPEDRHLTELSEWSKLNTRIRKVIESQISAFEQRLLDAAEGRSTLNLDAQLEIVAGLKDLLLASMRITTDGLKVLREPAKAAPTDSPESILRELQGGSGF